MQRQPLADDRQGIGAIGITVGAIGKQQGVAGKIDYIREVGVGIGIGAFDGLTQLGHTRRVVGAGQRVREGEVVAGVVLTLVGAQVQQRCSTRAGIGSRGNVGRARVEVEIWHVLGGVAITIEIEKVRKPIGIVASVDGRAGGGQAVIALGSRHELRVGSPGHALHDAVTGNQCADAALCIGPEDAVVDDRVVSGDVERRAVDLIVGDRDVAQLRALGCRVSVVKQIAARGGQMVVRDYGGDQADAGAAVEDRQAVVVAIAFDVQMEQREQTIVRDGGTMGGRVAMEVGGEEKCAAACIAQAQCAAVAIGTVVLESGRARVENVIRQHGAAVAGAVAVVELDVQQMQRGTWACLQETEWGRRGLAFQPSVRERECVGQDGQRVGAIGVAVGAVGKHQGMAGKIDVNGAALGIGALDRLAQFGHTGRVVGSAQGVGEGETATSRGAGGGVGRVSHATQAEAQ